MGSLRQRWACRGPHRGSRKYYYGGVAKLVIRGGPKNPFLTECRFESDYPHHNLKGEIVMYKAGDKVIATNNFASFLTAGKVYIVKEVYKHYYEDPPSYTSYVKVVSDTGVVISFFEWRFQKASKNPITKKDLM